MSRTLDHGLKRPAIALKGSKKRRANANFVKKAATQYLRGVHYVRDLQRIQRLMKQFIKINKSR